MASCIFASAATPGQHPPDAAIEDFFAGPAQTHTHSPPQPAAPAPPPWEEHRLGTVPYPAPAPDLAAASIEEFFASGSPALPAACSPRREPIARHALVVRLDGRALEPKLRPAGSLWFKFVVSVAEPQQMVEAAPWQMPDAAVLDVLGGDTLFTETIWLAFQEISAPPTLTLALWRAERGPGGAHPDDHPGVRRQARALHARAPT